MLEQNVQPVFGKQRFSALGPLDDANIVGIEQFRVSQIFDLFRAA